MAEYGAASRMTQSHPQRSVARWVMDRESALRDATQMWLPDWQDITSLLAPMCADTVTPHAPGESRTRQIFDSTGVHALQKLAANLQGEVTNSALEWHRLRLWDEQLSDDQETNAWLSTVNRHHMNIYNGSNFYQSMHTFYLNYAAFGTAALFIIDGQPSQVGYLPRVNFHPVPHGTYVIGDNADGIVRTFIRRCRFTPVQAWQMFAGHCSQKTVERLQNPTLMDVPYTYLHGVWEREDWEPGSQNNKKFPIASAYIELETQHLCDESGYLEWPVPVARWEKLTDSPWGFGLGHMALPDVRTINLMKELQIQMLTLWVQPPLKQVAESVFGAVSLEPLAVNIVKRPDDLSVFDLGGRPDLVQISQADLRMSINDVFFVNALDALPSPEQGNMTAYEVSQRIGMRARLLGPAFHRLLVEVLSPMIDRVFGLEWRKHQIPVPPQQVIDAAQRHQGNIDIEYQGPLAKAQRSTDVSAIAQIYAIGTQMAQATQRLQVFDVLDEDLALRRAADAASVPLELVRDAMAVSKMRAARQVAQEQATQLGQLQQGAQSLGQVAPFLRALQSQPQPGQSQGVAA